MAVLDTNVLIRYLTEDDEEQSSRALALLQEVEARRRSVFLPEAILVETIRVLSAPRSYAVDREVIRARLLTILAMPGVTMANKHIYQDSLDLYVAYSRLSFEAALCAAYARSGDDKTVISFDRDFRNLPDVVWEQT
jgi:predicted nucleic acid-binding protein